MHGSRLPFRKRAPILAKTGDDFLFKAAFGAFRDSFGSGVTAFQPKAKENFRMVPPISGADRASGPSPDAGAAASGAVFTGAAGAAAAKRDDF